MTNFDAANSPNMPKAANWGQDRRLEFIDTRLLWEGKINRSDITEFFKISVPQASLDMSRYLSLTNGTVQYDRSEKVYFATRDFTPVLASPLAQRYLNQVLAIDAGILPRSTSFLGWLPPIGGVQRPSRRIDTPVLRLVLHAIEYKRSVRLLYQSMNREAPSERTISPHALGFDGFRWHARAFCHVRGDFRDFVFARMLDVSDAGPTNADPSGDICWHREVKLELAPNPALGPGQRRAIELDYGMEQGRLVLSTREALAFYVMRQLGLDSKEDGAGRSQQIVLLNRADLEAFLRSE